MREVIELVRDMSKRDMLSKIESNQLSWINIMKGILIFLMVLSHTHVMSREYIFLFHMPVFFMISGYCWNSKHSTNYQSVFSYIKRKTIRLYIPFVLLNVTYVLLYNYMLKIGIFTSDSRFLELIINPPEKQHLYFPLSSKDILFHVLRSLIFAGGANILSNPTWFLSSLWIATVAHSVIELVLVKCNLAGNKRKTILLCVFFLSIAVAYIFDMKSVSIIGPIDRAPCTYACYLAGILIRELFEGKFSRYKLLTFDADTRIRVFRIIGSSLSLLLVFVLGFRIRLSSCVISNPLILIICMMLGWYLMMDISKIGSRQLLVFEYLGKSTMPILLFHLTIFKLVSYIYIVCTNSDSLLLASYPVIYSTPEWYRFLYAILGTLLPICLYEPYKRIKNMIISNKDLR